MIDGGCPEGSVETIAGLHREGNGQLGRCVKVRVVKWCLMCAIDIPDSFVIFLCLSHRSFSISLHLPLLSFPRILPSWFSLIFTHAVTILTGFVLIYGNPTCWRVVPLLFFCEAFSAPSGPGETPPLPPHSTHIAFISKYSNYLFTHLSLLWSLKGSDWILLISALPASGTQ